MSRELSQAQKDQEVLKAKREKIAVEVAAIKGENERLYTMHESQTRKGKQSTNSDVKEAKALRDDVESIKIRIATVTKENEMLGNRAAEIDKEVSGKVVEMDTLKKGVTNLEKELLETGKTREELQEKIKSHDAKSAGLYKDLQDLEKKLSSISTDKGRLSSDMEKAERELIELNSSRAQLETRMNDIKAELLSYTSAKMMEGKTDELESRSQWQSPTSKN